MITLETMIKRAAEAASSIPEIDNQDTALAEHRANWSDTRSTLSGLFSNMASASKADTGLIHKLFPQHNKGEVGSPLLKLASYSYLQVLRGGFLDELEKLAMAMVRPRASYVARSAAGGGAVAPLSAATKQNIAGHFATQRAGVEAASAGRPALAHPSYQDVAPAGVSGQTGVSTNYGQPSGLAPAVEAMRAKAQQPWYRRFLS